jgi:hypothetical protein
LIFPFNFIGSIDEFSEDVAAIPVAEIPPTATDPKTMFLIALLRVELPIS